MGPPPQAAARKDGHSVPRERTTEPLPSGGPRVVVCRLRNCRLRGLRKGLPGAVRWGSPLWGSNLGEQTGGAATQSPCKCSSLETGAGEGSSNPGAATATGAVPGRRDNRPRKPCADRAMASNRGVRTRSNPHVDPRVPDCGSEEATKSGTADKWRAMRERPPGRAAKDRDLRAEPSRPLSTIESECVPGTQSFVELRRAARSVSRSVSHGAAANGSELRLPRGNGAELAKAIRKPAEAPFSGAGPPANTLIALRNAGAGGRTRTDISVRTGDFESPASTNSATPAAWDAQCHIHRPRV